MCRSFSRQIPPSQPPRPRHPELHHQVPDLVVEPGVSLQQHEPVDDPPQGDGAQDDEDVCERDREAIEEDHQGHRPCGEEDVDDRAALDLYRDLSCKVVAGDRHVDEHRCEGRHRRPDDPEEGDEGEVEEDVHDRRRPGGVEGLPGLVDGVEAHRLEVHEDVDHLHQEEDGEGRGACGKARAVEEVEEAVAQDPAADGDRDGEEEGVGDGAGEGEGDAVEGAVGVPSADLGVEGGLEGGGGEGGGGGELEGDAVDTDLGGGHEVAEEDRVGVREDDGAAGGKKDPEGEGEDIFEVGGGEAGEAEAEEAEGEEAAGDHTGDESSHQAGSAVAEEDGDDLDENFDDVL